MRLSTEEKSGLNVQQLSASIKFYPEGMEFYDFDLNTGKSHLGISLRCTLKVLMTCQISQPK